LPLLAVIDEIATSCESNHKIAEHIFDSLHKYGSVFAQKLRFCFRKASESAKADFAHNNWLRLTGDVAE